jgi:hypothetical protein
MTLGPSLLTGWDKSILDICITVVQFADIQCPRSQLYVLNGNNRAIELLLLERIDITRIISTLATVPAQKRWDIGEGSGIKTILSNYINVLIQLHSCNHLSGRQSSSKGLFNIESLVLRAKSEFNGFSGKGCELFWSTGVLEYWQKQEPEFQLELILSLLHYSTTPLLQQTAA